MSLFGRFVACGDRKRGNRLTDRHTVTLAAHARRELISAEKSTKVQPSKKSRRTHVLHTAARHRCTKTQAQLEVHHAKWSNSPTQSKCCPKPYHTYSAPAYNGTRYSARLRGRARRYRGRDSAVIRENQPP